jgi:nodulation protein E
VSPAASPKVVITGMGCVSALGIGADETWRRVSTGSGGIRAVERRPMEGPAAWVDPQDVAAALAGGDLRRLGKLDPLSSFALLAALEAVGEAGLRDHPSLSQRTAILLGCGSPGNATLDAAFERLYAKGVGKLQPQTIPSSMMSAPPSHLAMLFGVHGPTMALSSACASSANALGEAMHMIRSGRVDVAIAGGSEACISYGSWVAWHALGVVAPDTCRPFSQGRRGLALGEGAAVLVLESEDHAAARGARVLGELAGYGASSDAADMTAPDQSGVEAAIRAAHRDAGVGPDRPGLISTHGTGTKLNDAVETAAMRAVYGAALAGSTVIATKSAHGHLIGGSGALEFLIGMQALAEGLAPPVLNYLGPDPDCDLPLALEPTPIAHDILISNSFAFGGLNAVLIGRKWP